jgi:hypothetical protein
VRLLERNSVVSKDFLVGPSPTLNLFFVYYEHKDHSPRGETVGLFLQIWHLFCKKGAYTAAKIILRENVD